MTHPTYYTYWHAAGYGRDDHRADELIARAIRHLGGDMTDYLLQTLGFRAHPVPMPSLDVRLPAGHGVRANMVRALRAARREVGHYVDCAITVACLRERQILTWDRPLTDDRARVIARTRVTERRLGGRWLEVDRVTTES